MKIIVPMAGSGARFVAAGYPDPKPLIPLGDGRRIIEHVLDMFQEPDDELVFICNEDHLQNTRMRETLLILRPGSQIVSIEPHKKGPVYTAMPALPYIKPDEEVIISYCDGTMPIPRQALVDHVRGKKLDGCLLTHTGFHPHTLSLTTKMAFVKEAGDGLISEVQEKASYTDDPASEHASSGVYYFARGEYVSKYFKQQLESGESFNGEFYITLVYNLMIRDGLRVGYFDTEHVAILGTPDEVSNFEAWGTVLKGSQVRNEDDLIRSYRYWKAYRRMEK